MKTNKFITTKEMSADDRMKFRISLEVDFDLNIVIGKVKALASNCSTLSDYENVASLVDDLNKTCDTYLNSANHENESENNTIELA